MKFFNFPNILILLAAIVGTVVQTGCRRNIKIKSPLEVEWEAYHQKERENYLDAAIKGYRKMCEYNPSYERACYDLSRLLFVENKLEEARESTLKFIFNFPDNALAPTALKRLFSSYKSDDSIDVGIQVLKNIVEKTKDTDLADSAMYCLAEAYEIKGDKDLEVQVLTQIVTKYGRWESQLWDDAMWRLVEIQGEIQNYEKQKKLLEDFLSQRESSWFIGSYNSRYHDDALMKLGKIYMQQKKFKKAYDIFYELGEFETSSLSDDGFFNAALALIEMNEKKKARRILKKILKDTPGSSGGKKATQLLKSLTY